MSSTVLRIVTSSLALASVLVGCAHQVDRVAFDPSKAGKKPDSWKCFETKLPFERTPRSYCYGDGGECEASRSTFQASHPEAASVGMCGLETKAFCFQWGEALERHCAKAKEECELQSKGKADNAPLWVKTVSSCSEL